MPSAGFGRLRVVTAEAALLTEEACAVPGPLMVAEVALAALGPLNKTNFLSGCEGVAIGASGVAVGGVHTYMLTHPMPGIQAGVNVPSACGSAAAAAIPGAA